MKNNKQELELFENQLMSYHIPRYEEFPILELYKDQIILFLNKHFAPFVGSEEEPILTSSMINNYVKHGIIPPPNGKKYTRRHLAYITVVCFLKQVLSMHEIKEVIKDSLQHTSERVAYQFFCDKMEQEFEACCDFGKKQNCEVVEHKGYLVCVLAKAVANKLYAQKIIQINSK